MSLLTPERVPVKVYKWDDVGAPALDKTAGCVMEIFKACLATGYGTKEGAGWTVPWEDMAAGVKVLRPEIGPHTDFYLRLSADTGTEMAAQVYLNMTDVNTGDLKLQCAAPYKYAKANSTGKWLMVASPRGFWFFCEQRFTSDVNKTGCFFVCGDTASSSSGTRAVFLQHSGASSNSGDYDSVFGSQGKGNRYQIGKLLCEKDGALRVVDKDLTSQFNGHTQFTDALHLSLSYMISDKSLYVMPGVLTPSNAAQETNFTVKDISQSGTQDNAIVFGTSGYVDTNLYIRINEWGY